MKKRVLKMFVMCLVICLTCSCLSLVANAEVKSDIKEVKMLAKSGDKGKESCQIEIWFNPNLNAVQDLNLERTKNEVQNLIKINGFTIKQIVDFNNTNKCLQTHKWERQIIYIWNELYGVKGYLPCEKHDTIDNCNCDKNTLKPIMAYDDTDTLEYLKGFMLDGIQPLEENIMYGFKKDIWWRDGTVLPVTDGWINASSEVIEGEGPSEFLDYNKNPKLNFDSQIMTKGKAKYYSAINGETGFNIRLAHLSAKGFLVNLLTKDGEGIKIKYYTENWSNYKIETTYCYKNNEGIATENSEILSFADGWHWYANNAEWQTHSIKMFRDDNGYIVVKLNNIPLKLLDSSSPFYQFDASEMNAEVSFFDFNPGQSLSLGKIGTKDVNDIEFQEVTSLDFPNETFQATFNIVFNKNICKIFDTFVNRKDYFIQNYLYINGYSINEINKESEKVQIHRQNNTLFLYVLKDTKVPNSTNDLIVNNKPLNIEIKQGFNANDELETKKDSKLFYNYEHKNWYPVETFNEVDVNFVQGIWEVGALGFATQIEFGEIVSYRDILSVSNTLGILDNIILNGHSIREIKQSIYDYEKDANGEYKKDENGNKIPIMATVEAHWMTGKRLHLFVRATEENGGFMPTKKNTIEILNNLVTPQGDKVSSAQKFEFKPNYGVGSFWVERPNNEGVVLEEIKIDRIEAPAQDVVSGNVLFYVYFNQAIVDKPLVFLQGEPWWLQAAGLYDANSVRINNLSGIYESLRDNLFFNGKSFNELFLSETNLGFQQTAIMIHFGDGSLNRMVFAVGGTYDGKPLKEDKSNKSVNMIEDINQPFTFEFKKGFVSMLGGEIKKDVKYTYDATHKSFYKDGEVVSISSADINSINYDGKQIKNGDTISLNNVTKLNKNLLFVDLVDKNAIYEIIGGDILNIGVNEISIKVTASDKSQEKTYKFFIDNKAEIIEKKGCQDKKSGMGTEVLILLMTCSLVLIKRRG